MPRSAPSSALSTGDAAQLSHPQPSRGQPRALHPDLTDKGTAPDPLSFSFPLHHSNLPLRAPERLWKPPFPSVLEGHGSPCGCWADRWGRGAGGGGEPCSSGGWKTPGRPVPLEEAAAYSCSAQGWPEGNMDRERCEQQFGQRWASHSHPPAPIGRPYVEPGSRPGPKRACREDPCRRGEEVLEHSVLHQFCGPFRSPRRGGGRSATAEKRPVCPWE